MSHVRRACKLAWTQQYESWLSVSKSRFFTKAIPFSENTSITRKKFQLITSAIATLNAWVWLGKALHQTTNAHVSCWLISPLQILKHFWSAARWKIFIYFYFVSECATEFQDGLDTKAMSRGASVQNARICTFVWKSILRKFYFEE